MSGFVLPVAGHICADNLTLCSSLLQRIYKPGEKDCWDAYEIVWLDTSYAKLAAVSL